MSRELLRRAAVALQHALEARTIEYQVRHADEARGAFEEASRLFDARRDSLASKPSPAARLIAARALVFASSELQEFEHRLRALEERIAESLRSNEDPRRIRHLRLAE